jgi:hypothetical protein
MKDWRRRCRKFEGPLLPCSAVQAAQWLRRKLRLKLGFTTELVRVPKDRAIFLREQGKMTRGWTDPGVV